MSEQWQRPLQFSLSSLLVLTLAVGAFLGGRLSKQSEIDRALVQVETAQSQLAMAQAKKNSLWPKPFVRVIYPNQNQKLDSGLLSHLRTFYTDLDTEVKIQGIRQKIPDSIEEGMRLDSIQRVRQYK